MRKLSVIFFVLLLISIVACTSKGSNNHNGTTTSTHTTIEQQTKDNNLSLKNDSTIIGKVIGIIDGDTYDIFLEENKKVRVRMEGIDAPERGMPFHQKSKQYLSGLCFGKQVTINITGKDRYKRILAYTYLEEGQELGQEMIKAGYAWHFKKYNSDTILSNLEIEARNLKKGLWVEDNPMPPWKNRSLHRQGISTKDSFNITEQNR